MEMNRPLFSEKRKELKKVGSAVRAIKTETSEQKMFQIFFFLRKHFIQYY
jgi:hypothetical protein